MEEEGYLCFDIGEKNLSYCLMKCINKKIEIIKWEIIDISFKKLFCKEIINKRAICNKKSKYYEEINDEIKSYCDYHSKEIKLNNKLYFKKLLLVSKNEKLSENKTNKLNNLIVRLLNSLNYINGIMNENKMRNIEIYIENQLTQNNDMKNIAICVLMFFINIKMFNDEIKIVNFMNANIKTTENVFNKIINNIKISKIESINNLNYLIEQNDEIIDYYIFKKNKNIEKLNIIKLFDLIEKNIEENKNINLFHLSKEINKKKAYRKIIVILMCNIFVKKINKSYNNIININDYYKTLKKDDKADSLIYCLIAIMKKHNITNINELK